MFQIGDGLKIDSDAIHGAPKVTRSQISTGHFVSRQLISSKAIVSQVQVGAKDQTLFMLPFNTTPTTYGLSSKHKSSSDVKRGL